MSQRQIVKGDSIWTLQEPYSQPSMQDTIPAVDAAAVN